MLFREQFNEYMTKLDCTAKEINSFSGISNATLSRYRSGERIPELASDSFDKLCAAIADIAKQKNLPDISENSVRDSFMQCNDFISTDKEQLRQNFNTLISVMNINLTKLCQSTNYNISSIFRFRNGSRQPSDPEQFAEAVAVFISREADTENERSVLAELIGCSADEITDSSERITKVKKWLLEGNRPQHESGISKFLNKLDEFDLNEYIKAIHFDEMKVPTFPFQLPTSKFYYGIKEMMESELDFLKATVLSKSTSPVTMYSDMPMTEMAKDPEFPKKWMYGMALLLKKGLHLNNIHNIDRSFEEMMLGLESWIPMYMTGQISPYYLKNNQNNTFNHFIRVSGAAALSGEAISGYHSDGRYYLSKNKEDIKYYTKRAEDLLKNAFPLMDIYREDSAGKLNAFLLSDSHTAGKRRSILSTLPIYTMDKKYLKQFLQKRGISAPEQQHIIDFAENQREIAEEILKNDIIEDEIPHISAQDFDTCPIAMPLSGMFYEKDIRYTYEEYCEHLKQSKIFAETHPNYILTETATNPFRNLQILIHEGKWAMISKGSAPAIHFIIHHPKLRNAIENFVPPVVDIQ